MTNSKQARSHLRLVLAPKARKVSGDRFRADAAQDEFRRRFNAAQAKLAQ